MLKEAFILALQINAVYVAFSEGNIFESVQVAGANMLDKALGPKTSKFVQKPLWSCPVCMSSLWTIILTQKLIPHKGKLILTVCGINYVIHEFLNRADDDN